MVRIWINTLNWILMFLWFGLTVLWMRILAVSENGIFSVPMHLLVTYVICSGLVVASIVANSQEAREHEELISRLKITLDS